MGSYFFSNPKRSPIVIILNNSGYGTERLILDDLFNDVNPWNYNALPDILNTGLGFEVKTENQLDEALQTSRQSTEEICILDVQLDPDDKSQTLERMAKAFASRI